jgi:3-hydroxybutyryl-CoA dehydrogenase
MSDHVMVVGVGLMGSQIGCEYALHGHPVTWMTRERSGAERRIEAALALAVEHGLADANDSARAHARMNHADDLPAGTPGPVLIVESLPEQQDLKVVLLAELAARYPAALLASNTSSLSITTLARLAGAEQRLVGTHYWNPPILMPLVEVIAGQQTSATTIERVTALVRGIGKRPVALAREAPGFIWNRLQAAVLRECLWLVEHDIATPETIDEAMRDGLARRWRQTGPFETVGLGGVPTFDAIARNLFSELSNADSGSFGGHVPTDPRQLAELRLARDRALAAELAAEIADGRTSAGDANLTALSDA